MLESLFNKVAGLKAFNFIKKILQHISFPVKFAKNFKNTFFLTEHLRWLLVAWGGGRAEHNIDVNFCITICFALELIAALKRLRFSWFFLVS